MFFSLPLFASQENRLEFDPDTNDPEMNSVLSLPLAVVREFLSFSFFAVFTYHLFSSIINYLYNLFMRYGYFFPYFQLSSACDFPFSIFILRFLCTKENGSLTAVDVLTSDSSFSNLLSMDFRNYFLTFLSFFSLGPLDAWPDL